MPTKKTVAASQSKAKVVKRELPLNAPAAAAPARVTAPDAVPAARRAAEPVAAVARSAKTPRKAVRKPAAKRTGTRPAPAAAREIAPAAAREIVPGPVAAARKVPGAQELTAAGQDMIETYEICGAIAAKGMESLGKQVVSLARSSARAQFALTEALIQATSVQEAIEAQTEIARESLDNLAAEFATLTGMSLELTQELMEPFQTRVNEATRSLWEPLAA